MHVLTRFATCLPAAAVGTLTKACSSRSVTILTGVRVPTESDDPERFWNVQGRSQAAVPGPTPDSDGILAQMREDFLELCETDHRGVVAFLLRCGAGSDDACEAAQEAFLAGWNMLMTQPDQWAAVANKAGWLRRTALNCWKRPPGLPRTSRELLVDELPEYSLAGSDPGQLIPLTIVVLTTLSRMDERERIIWAFHRDGFRNVEIADLLGIDAQSVTDLLKRVRAALRQAVAPEERKAR
jgi:DNA-directed RNA polymerase specialized sigma24 family protein